MLSEATYIGAAIRLRRIQGNSRHLQESKKLHSMGKVRYEYGHQRPVSRGYYADSVNSGSSQTHNTFWCTGLATPLPPKITTVEYKTVGSTSRAALSCIW